MQIHDLSQPAGWLPLVFLGLLALAMLVYVILDGYDLGIGILLRRAGDEEKDMMIASIGPFWDANETWLVLGVGILLTAFPIAHGIILTSLYLPVTLMLIGLILRGVAFDFRVKARAHHKPWWNRAFYTGSLLASLSQGLMLGRYITGFAPGVASWLFAVFVALALAAGYSLLGSCWLILKTSGTLQLRAVRWARGSLWLTALGVAAVSVVTPMVSSRIFDKWFTLDNLVWLFPIPLLTAGLFLWIERLLRAFPDRQAAGDTRHDWLPFVISAGIFLLAFIGLAYSVFPFLVVDRVDIWQAASAPKSLMFLLVGVVIVLPAILFYTVYAYRVFWGKAHPLSYY